MSLKVATNALGRRLLREAKELAFLTAYFYLAFVVVVFYKATVLHAYGVHYVVFGLAIAKAVLIAKFMLIGRFLLPFLPNNSETSPEWRTSRYHRAMFTMFGRQPWRISKP